MHPELTKQGIIDRLIHYKDGYASQPGDIDSNEESEYDDEESEEEKKVDNFEAKKQ